MKEEWKAYNKCKVSNHGRVIGERDSLLKAEILHNGYERVRVCDEDGVQRKVRVHKLVMLVFGPKPENEYLQINHIDRNRTNNRIDNLERCTASENMYHASNKELISSKIEKNLITEDLFKIVSLLHLKVSKKLVSDMFNISYNRVRSIEKRYIK